VNYQFNNSPSVVCVNPEFTTQSMQIKTCSQQQFYWSGHDKQMQNKISKATRFKTTLK